MKGVAKRSGVVTDVQEGSAAFLASPIWVIYSQLHSQLDSQIYSNLKLTIKLTIRVMVGTGLIRDKAAIICVDLWTIAPRPYG